MKLYYSKGSCSLACHIALFELGNKFETESVNLKTKVTASGGDYTKINPKGSVPALRLDNGEILTEAAVILQFIGDQKPEAQLIPKTGSFERYRAQEWLNFIATEIHKGFSPLWNDKFPEDGKTLVKERLGKHFDFLSAHLKDKAYLMGATFTVADAYLFTVLSWSPYVKLDMATWPVLLGYCEKVKARPNVLAALKAEGLIK